MFPGLLSDLACHGDLVFPSWILQVKSSVLSDSTTPWTAACQASLSIAESDTTERLNRMELDAGASQVALVVKNPSTSAGGMSDAGSIPG